jgi:hypothetical protein
MTDSWKTNKEMKRDNSGDRVSRFFYLDEKLMLKRLLPTLMVFGIIIIIFQTHLVFASENFQTRFGNVTLNIPHPKNLCLLKNTTAERLLFELNSEMQKKSGNKLLAYWIDCVSHKKIQTDGSNELFFREWVMVVGTLTGSPKKENTYPKATAKQFLKAMVKQYSEASIDDIKKTVNKNFSEYDLEDYPTIIDDPINLGILGITDSLHVGIIFRVKAQGSHNQNISTAHWYSITPPFSQPRPESSQHFYCSPERI